MVKVVYISLTITVGIVSRLGIAECSVIPQLLITSLFKPEICNEKTEILNGVVVHYTGFTRDVKVFDSSYDRNEPVSFRLGMGEVMLGWEQGLLDMCVGEKRRLVIPVHLVTGKPGLKIVAPSGRTLYYDFELLEINKVPPKLYEFFKEIDYNSDRQLSRDEVKNYLIKHFPFETDSGNIILGYAENLKQIERQVEEFFKTDDLDGDGLVSDKEFVRPNHQEL